MGSLVGCHLRGRTESDTTEAMQQQQQQGGFYFFIMIFGEHASGHAGS